MQLSKRFLSFVQLQLSSFESVAEIQYLVLYVAQSREDESPSLEAIGHWPSLAKALPAVENDPELRAPSPTRRWYPLQDDSMLLGVLRVEHVKNEYLWTDVLDQRLQATAASLGQCLGLELERGKLIEQLTQQQDQLGLMVHQLRNPLAALRTYAQLLLRRMGPNNKHRNLVENLLTEQAQLNQYVSALDEMSQVQLPARIETSTPLLLPPVVSKTESLKIQSLLEPLVERAEARATLLERKWNSPKIWPKWCLDPRDPKDAVIAEIVANLLENAFKYSQKNNSIGLYLDNKGLYVWDSGRPIPEEDREKIFMKGFRGEDIKASGRGFGLALARQLAEDIQCELILIISPVRINSSLPKKGNVFFLKLP